MALLVDRRALKAERRRCLELVKAYRSHLESTLDRVRSNPKYQTPQYRVASLILTVDKIITSLKGVEDKIKCLRSEEGGDFSMEEMEKAEAIIAEQNKNPFEV